MTRIKKTIQRTALVGMARVVREITEGKARKASRVKDPMETVRADIVGEAAIIPVGRTEGSLALWRDLNGTIRRTRQTPRKLPLEWAGLAVTRAIKKQATSPAKKA